MDICQDINMYVGCDLASSVSRRNAAHPGALLQNADGARCIVG